MRIVVAMLAFTACQAPAQCRSSALLVRWPHETTTLRAPGVNRDVHWALPEGEPPADGWPVALLFQGSGFPASLYWSAPRGAPFGGLHQVELTAALLDSGIAVLTPEALGEGLTCWNTNVPPWSTNWEASPDAAMIDALDEALSDGAFGPLDPARQVAGGISSGGYMTSRLAVTTPERFAAVAIIAAAYMDCAGPLCDVPEVPIAAHPPALFLHGTLDPLVPIGTMRRTRDWLDASGIPTSTHEKKAGLHAWPAQAPAWVDSWFRTALAE